MTEARPYGTTLFVPGSAPAAPAAPMGWRGTPWNWGYGDRMEGSSSGTSWLLIIMVLVLLVCITTMVLTGELF